MKARIVLVLALFPLLISSVVFAQKPSFDGVVPRGFALITPKISDEQLKGVLVLATPYRECPAILGRYFEFFEDSNGDVRIVAWLVPPEVENAHRLSEQYRFFSVYDQRYLTLTMDGWKRSILINNPMTSDSTVFSMIKEFCVLPDLFAAFCKRVLGENFNIGNMGLDPSVPYGLQLYRKTLLLRYNGELCLLWFERTSRGARKWRSLKQGEAIAEIPSFDKFVDEVEAQMPRR